MIKPRITWEAVFTMWRCALRGHLYAGLGMTPREAYDAWFFLNWR